LREQNLSFAEFTRQLSARQRQQLHREPLAPERLAWLTQLVADSHQRQREIEAADTLNFDDFLAAYFAGAMEEHT